MVHTDTSGWLKPSTLAKTYRKMNGRKGVSRIFIYQLIEKEKANPDSTDIDVQIIDGIPFVRQKF